jgi:glycosyltransferase involved in cell wall biosynthesis
MISVLLPSRGRPKLLAESLTSLQNLASSGYLLEYLVAYDPDDVTTASVAQAHGCKTTRAPERWGYYELGKYYNLLTAKAIGDWLLLWNDDALMTTPGWNRIIEIQHPHILVVDLHTDLTDMAVCAFPAVHSRAVEAVGYFCPPETSHSDSYWQDVGRRTGRIAPVNVHVHHDRYDLTGNNNDTVYQEGRDQYRSDEYYGPVVQARIATDVIKIGELP